MGWSFRAAVLFAIVARAGASEAAELIVDAPPPLARAADEIRRVDLARLEADLRRAGLPMPPRIRVTLMETSNPAAAELPEWVVGLAAGTEDLLIFPQRVVPYPYDSLTSVLRHEITHLSLNTRAGPGAVPRWFHEGVAMSVDVGWGQSSQLRLLIAMLSQPDTGNLSRLFATGARSDVERAYGLSAAVIDHLRRTSGDDVAGRIAARVRLGVPFAQAFSEVTGTTPDAAATQAWASYRRWTRWVPALTTGSAMWGGILALAALAYVIRRRHRARQRQRWDEEDAERDETAAPVVEGSDRPRSKAG
jgi:hypothetical protein